MKNTAVELLYIVIPFKKPDILSRVLGIVPGGLGETGPASPLTEEPRPVSRW